MTTYNYSYNVLINRLEAFAAGHYLIKRFTHGQIDLADMDQNEQYPFMHVVPNNIRPVDGGLQFDFQIMFADIPRDKQLKAEYQREIISDCVRLAQDLIAEVKNGIVLFGFDVQLASNPTIEPFQEEYKNTLTGVTFSLQLEVPWDWSACEIPATWAVGGVSTGGNGTGLTGLVLKTNNVDNVVQTMLNLVDGNQITITDNGDGSVTINSTAGATAWGDITGDLANQIDLIAALNLKADIASLAAVAFSNDYNDLDNLPTIPTATSELTNDSGFITIGDVPPQANADWNASSGVAQILNKPSIPAAQVNSDWNASSGLAQILNKPSLATVATSGSYNDLTNKPTIPAAQVNSDWNAVSGLAQILNKPSLATVATSGSYNDLSNKPTIPAAQIQSDWNQSNTSALDYIKNKPSVGLGSVTSVALTAPAAFTVTGSPITTSGTLAITGAGSVSQYIDGTGALQTTATALPPNGTAGNDLQGTYPNPTVHRIHGVDMQSGTPTADDTWVYGGSPAKWQHQKLHSNQVTNDSTVTGANVDSALTALNSGKQATLVSGTNIKTINSTTLLGSGNITTGTVTSVAELTLDTTGTDLSSTVATGSTTPIITLSVPTASATNRGALSSADWSTFNGKQANIGLTTVGTALATLTNPSAISYLRINANNSVTALTLAQLKSELGIANQISYVTLASDVNITASNTTLADITGLSFPIVSGSSYRFRAELQMQTSASATGCKFAVNASSTVGSIVYRTTHVSGLQSGITTWGAFALDSATTVTGAVTTQQYVTIEGLIVANANGTVIMRFGKSVATAGTLAIKAGSVLQYQTL